MATTPKCLDEKLKQKIEIWIAHNQDLNDASVAKEQFESAKSRLANGDNKISNGKDHSGGIVLDGQYYAQLFEQIFSGKGLGKYIEFEDDYFKVNFKDRKYKELIDPTIIPNDDGDELDDLIEFIQADALLKKPRIRSIEFFDYYIHPKCMTQNRIEKLIKSITDNHRLEKLKITFSKQLSKIIKEFDKELAALIHNKPYLRILEIQFYNSKDQATLDLLKAAQSCPNLEYLNINFVSVKQDMLPPAAKIMAEHSLKFSRLNTVYIMIPLVMDATTIHSVLETLHSLSINIRFDNIRSNNYEIHDTVEQFLKSPTCLLNGIHLDKMLAPQLMETLKQHPTLKIMMAHGDRDEEYQKKFKEMISSAPSLQRICVNYLKFQLEDLKKLRDNQNIWLQYLKNLCPTINVSTGNKLTNPIIAMIADYIDEYHGDLNQLPNHLTGTELRYCNKFDDLKKEFEKSYLFNEEDFQKPGVGFGRLWQNSMDPSIPLTFNRINVNHNNWRLLAAPKQEDKKETNVKFP